MEKKLEDGALLVAQTGPLNGQRYGLRNSIVLGRESSCDIVIPDRQVSRQHAQVSIMPNGIFLEDLGSKNGTHHNGHPIVEPIQLRDGDVIQIALAQKFVFLSSDSTVPLDIERISLHEFMKTDGQAHVEKVPGRLLMDKRSRRVWINIKKNEDTFEEREILPPLSVSQFRLLELLYDNQGQVVSRPDLGTAVWGEDQVFEISEQALDALVRRLRDRISNTYPYHEYIVTIRGHGLRLENP